MNADHIAAAAAGVVAVLLLTWGVCRHLTRPLPDQKPPHVARPRISTEEWDRLRALQDKARAEIDAERGHFAAWEKELTS